MKTWWGPGFAFQAPTGWDVWSGGSTQVTIQGGFLGDGTLPGTFDAQLRLDTDADRGDFAIHDGYLRDQPPTEAFRVDDRRALRVIRVGRASDVSTWRYVAMIKILLSHRQPEQIVDLELVSSDEAVGAQTLETILSGIEFDLARGALQRPPSFDGIPHRLGEPVLAPKQLADEAVRVGLPRDWLRADGSPDELASLSNHVGALRHYWGRPGDATVRVVTTPDLPDPDEVRAETWVNLHDGPMETPVGDAYVMIDHGIPAAGGYCEGDEWSARAYIPRRTVDGYLVISLYGCDVPGMRQLFIRILDSLERTG